MVAQGARSCEKIAGGEPPLSRSTAILQVLSCTAETDYADDNGKVALGPGWQLLVQAAVGIAGIKKQCLHRGRPWLAADAGGQSQTTAMGNPLL
jgi:hypothetical protein